MNMIDALKQAKNSDQWARPVGWRGLKIAICWHRGIGWVDVPDPRGGRPAIIPANEYDYEWEVVSPRLVNTGR